MVVFELDEVEIDHCLGCRGIWLDSGELELLLESVQEKNQVLTSFEIDKTSHEKKRKCPICLKKMDKVSWGKDKKVLIDKCRNGDGIWFDAGELCEVIDTVSIDRNNKIISMLKDVFRNSLTK